MHNVLTSLQRVVLEGLFNGGIARRGFFLTGGTALAEYYLGHRYSDDLDLFQRGSGPLEAGDISHVLSVLGSMGMQVDRTKDLDMQKELLVSRAGTTDLPLVVHLCRDAAVRMEAPQTHGPVVVDSLLDIAVNKTDTILSRAPSEPKDYCDLYFILQSTSYTLDYLLARAREKNGSFEHEENLLRFAVNLRDAGSLQLQPKIRMIKPLSLDELAGYLVPLADELINRYRPQGG